MRLCYAADLHGRATLYAQLTNLVARERPDALILGGDQCPLSFGPTAAADQRDWLATTFRAFLTAVAPICPVYWNSGNHDLAATLEVLEMPEWEALIQLGDMRSHHLHGGPRLVGFPYNPMSGWPFADWVLLDEDQTTQGWQATVRVTRGARVLERDTTEFLAGQMSLAQKLAQLQTESLPNAILVCHVPPFGSGLDLSFHGHIGSRALADHLTTHAYPLALVGHVHEAPYECRYWARYVGGTPVVNPGQQGDGLHAVLFEWPNVVGTLRHTIFGRDWQVEESPDTSAWRQELEAKWNAIHM